MLINKKSVKPEHLSFKRNKFQQKMEFLRKG